MKKLTILSLFALILFALVASTAAQDTTTSTVTDDQVNAIASKLYCPVCENIPLDTCGTAACAEWRAEIRGYLEQGWTEDQIIADFVRRFGDRVVGTPQDPTLRALSLVTPYILTLLVFALGVYVFIRWRAQRNGAAEALAATPQQDDDYRSQFERDLAG